MNKEEINLILNKEKIEYFICLEKSSNEEFIKKIPDNKVDFICIDPPYSISKKSNFKKGGGVERFKISTDFGDWDKSNNLKEIFPSFVRILKNNGSILSFYDIWKISNLFEIMNSNNMKQIRFIEWIKSNPVPINSKINYLTNSREIALFAVKKSKPIFNSKYDNGIYNYPICHEKGRIHPTQKPLMLMENIITKHSNEKSLVLDCYSGSGTTAVACLKLKRNFIGCEINEEYYKLSINRLEEMIKTLNKGVIMLKNDENSKIFGIL